MLRQIPRLKIADWLMLIGQLVVCRQANLIRAVLVATFWLKNQPYRNGVGWLVGRRVRLCRVADGWLAPGCGRAGVATGGVSRQVLWRGEQHLGC